MEGGGGLLGFMVYTEYIKFRLLFWDIYAVNALFFGTLRAISDPNFTKMVRVVKKTKLP